MFVYRIDILSARAIESFCDIAMKKKMCANALYVIFFHLHYVLVKEYCINQGFFLKHCDSEICVKWIRITKELVYIS